MLRDERRPGDYPGGDKVGSLCESLGAIETDALIRYINATYQNASAKNLLRFLHNQGYIINDEQGGYVYATVKGQPSLSASIYFDLFRTLSKDPEDCIDPSTFPIDMQMLLSGKIYHIINLDEGAEQKIQYRYALPKALIEGVTREKDSEEEKERKRIGLVLISVNEHQKNKILLNDYIDLLPAKLLLAKVTVSGDRHIELIEKSKGGDHEWI